jgi:hypothetical protein
MAHIDANTPSGSINSFLSRSRGGNPDLDVYVISGESETALRIYDSIEQSEGNLVFANIDRNGVRDDAVVVDRQGNVFYGNRMDLANVNEDEMAVTAISRQMPNQPLTFTDHSEVAPIRGTTR